MLSALCAMFVATLPLTDGMTLRFLGIPIKIYEIASVPIFLMICFRKEYLKGFKLPVTLILFVAWSVQSTLLALPHVEDYLVYLWPGRESVLLSMLTRICYALYYLGAFGLLCFIFEQYGERKMIRIFMFSGALVVAYHLTNSLLSIFTGEMLLLPNSSAQFINLPIGRAFRNGTFHEGNYIGIYYLVCLFFAEIYIHKTGQLKIFRWIFLLGVFLPFSTTTYIATVTFYAVYFLMTRRYLLIVFALVSVLGVFTFVPFSRRVTYEKLADKENKISHSRNDRLRTMRIAYYVFKDHPISGVGLGNYGYHFPEYVDWNVQGKVIANNVYASILAETGAPGLLLYLWFLIVIFQKIRTVTDEQIRALMAAAWSAVGLALAAFPSYELTFLSFLFAFILVYKGTEWQN